MSEDIFASLGIDTSGYLSQLAEARSFTDTTSAAMAASLARVVLPSLDVSAYAASLQSIGTASASATAQSAALGETTAQTASTTTQAASAATTLAQGQTAQAAAAGAAASAQQQLAAQTLSYSTGAQGAAAATGQASGGLSEYTRILQAGAAAEGQLTAQLTATQAAAEAAAVAQQALRTANEQARAVSADLTASEEQQQVATANLAVALGQAQQAYAATRQSMADTRVVLADVRAEMASNLMVTDELLAGVQGLAKGQSQLSAQAGSLNVSLGSARQTMGTLAQSTKDAGEAAEAHRSRLTSLIATQLLFNQAIQISQTLLPGLTSELRAGETGFQAYIATGNAYIAVAAATVSWVGQETAAFITYSDTIRNFSHETGLSQQTVQGLGYELQAILGKSNLGIQSLSMFAEKVTLAGQSLREGQPISKQFGDAIGALNINLAEFVRLPADQQMLLLAQQTQTLATEQERAGVVMELFGRYGRQLIPMFQAGPAAMREWIAKTQEMGASVAGTQDKILAFHKTQTELEIASQALANRIGEVVVPAFGLAAKAATNVEETVVKLIDLASRPIVFVFEFKFPGAGSIGDVLGGIANQLSKSTAGNLVGPIVAEASALNAALHNLQTTQKLTETSSLQMSGALLTAGEATETAAKKASDAATAYNLLQPATVHLQQTSDSTSVAVSGVSSALDHLSAGVESSSSKLAQATAEYDRQRLALAQLVPGTAAYIAQQAVVGGDEKVVAGLREQNQLYKSQQEAVAGLFKEYQKGAVSAAEFTTRLEALAGGLVQGLEVITPEAARAAAAQQQVAEAAKTWDAANKTLQSSLAGLRSGLAAFTGDLAKNAVSDAAAFSGAYGAAALDVAQKLHAASVTAVDDWHQAALQMATDSATLRDAVGADAIAAAQRRVDADQQIVTSSKATADAAVANENQYRSALEAGAKQQISLAGEIFDNEQRISHQTLEEKQTNLGRYLQSEIDVDKQLLALTQELARDETDEAIKATLAKIRLKEQERDATFETARQGIAAEQGYLNALKTSRDDQRKLAGEVFDADLRLKHLTLEERKTDEARYLVAVIDTASQILDINKQLATNLTAISRAIYTARKAFLDQELKDAQEGVRREEEKAGYIKKDEKGPTGLDALAGISNEGLTKGQVAEINSETAAINEVTSAKKAGIEVDRQQDDLTKQVGASKQLVLQGQLDLYRATTEAARGQATVDLAATAAAQQNYLAVAAAANGRATAEVNLAKAGYTAQKEISDQSVADFDAALAKQSTAQTAFDSQQQASAAARKQADADYRSGLAATGTLLSGLQADFAFTTGQFGAALQEGAVATSQAARESVQTWRDANAQVLADDRALTADLAPEARKRLEDKRQADLDIATSARDTATAQVGALKTWTDAVRTSITTGKGLLAGFDKDIIATLGALGPAASAAFAPLAHGADEAVRAWQLADGQVLELDQLLATKLPEDQRIIVQAQRDAAAQSAGVALQNAQDRIAAENLYVQTVLAAERDLVSQRAALFDAQHKLDHLTFTERRLGLGDWLQAEILVHQDIKKLEEELTTTTDAEVAKRLQAQIEADKKRLDDLTETVREIGVQVQDADAAIAAAAKSTATTVASAATSAASSFGGVGAAVSANITQPLQQAKSAAQQLQDQLSQLEGVFSSRTTEELGQQKIADQLQIQIAQLEESGASAASPQVAALQKQLDAINATTKAYAEERSAQADLAKVTGDLNAGMSNSIAQVRASSGALALLETQSQKSTTVLGTFQTSVGDASAAIQVWVKAIQAAAASASSTASSASSTAGASQVTGGSSGAGGSVSVMQAFPHYAAGTNFVPSSGLAHVDRGEIIVPAALSGGLQGPAFSSSGGGKGTTVTFQPGAIQINGSGLNEQQLGRAIQAGVRSAINEDLGRGAHLHDVA